MTSRKGVWCRGAGSKAAGPWRPRGHQPCPWEDEFGVAEMHLGCLAPVAAHCIVMACHFHGASTSYLVVRQLKTTPSKKPS